MKKQGGFTILEVSLFLAISALVAVFLLAGLRAMVHQQEWRDSLNTMRTLIQTEYQNVRSGLNDRTVLPSVCHSDVVSVAGTSDCLAIGRVIQFTTGAGTFSAADVFATTPVDPSHFNGSDVDALNASGLEIANVTTAQTIPWQNTFAEGLTLSAGNSFSRLAILRSPIGSAILIFALPDTIALASDSSISGSILSSTQTNIPLAILINNTGSNFGVRGGAICIGAGSSSSSVLVASPVNPASDSYSTIKMRCQL